MRADIVIVFTGLLLSCHSAYGQCSFPTPLPITDLSTRYSYLRVDNANNNDLAAPGQGICKLEIRFTHENVGDINLFLSSPNGIIYQLIKQGGSRPTKGTTWDVSFIPCSQDAKPDQGNFIKPVWDSDQDWGQNNLYSGAYYAETCLEEINNGPVNGIWALTTSDVTGTASGVIESFSLVFCDPSGITCSDCVRAGGTISRDTVFSCGGESNLGAIRIFPTYSGFEPDPSEYAYRFVVIGSGKILDITRLPDLQSAPAGDYIIYGISIANQDLPTLDAFIGQSFNTLSSALAAARLGFCATFSNGFKVYRILSDPMSTTRVTKFVCPESPIIFDGQTITTAGIYNGTLTSQAGCDSIVELNVVSYDISTPILDPGTISCANKPLLLSWNNTQFASTPAYKWSTVDGSILSGVRTANAQIDLPGNYQLAISLGGCADTISIDVNSDGSLPTLLVGDIVMDCLVNIGQLRPISNALSFSWTGPFGYTSTNQNIDVTEPGQYTVTAVGTNCAVRKTISVGADFDRPQDVEVTGGAIRCRGDSVQLKATSTSNVRYQWSGPFGFNSSQQNPWASEPGIYTVRIGNAASGCTETREVEVFSLFREPAITLTGVVLDCRGASKRITTTVNDNLASFAWSGPAGYTSAEKSPLVNLPGTYQVTVKDVNQCSYFESAVVSIDTVKPTVTANDITLKCPQDDFTLTPNVSSLHPANYAWSGPNGYISSDKDAVATQPGTYFIRVTDPVNGCSAATSLEVLPDPMQPTLTTSQGKLNCEQDQDTLVVISSCAGGCSFDWDGPNGFTETNDSVIIQAAGIYNVKVTDISSGCFSKSSYRVTYDTIPIPRNVRVIPIGCTTEGSVTLVNSSQIRDFRWIDTITNTSFTTTVLTTTQPKVYALESTDRNGCVVSAQFYTIEVQDDVPLVTIISDSINCANDSVALGITLTNYPLGQVRDYNWSLPNNQISSRANPRVGIAGSVGVRVTMNNGCQGDAIGEIGTDFSVPNLQANGGTFPCSDTGIVLGFNVERAPLSTYWTGPNGFQSYQFTPTASLPGIYKLQIQGANGCLASDTAFVAYSDRIPHLEITGDTVTCLDTAGNLSFNTDAAPGFSYRWLDPGGRVNLSRNITTTLVGSYELELVDTNGCKVIANGVIDIDTISFAASISSGIINCNEPATQLTLDTIRSQLAYTWLFDSSIVASIAEPVVSRGGEYTLVTTYINGCQRLITHIVEADTITPLFSLSPDTLNCENSKITLSPTPVQGGVNYEWTGPGTYSASGFNALITQPGQYTLVATSNNGCQRQESAAIEASFEVPSIMIDSTFIPCSGDSALLSFQTMDMLKETNWFGPGGFYEGSQKAKTLQAGTYYLLAKGLNGCEAFDSQFVSAVPLLDSIIISNEKIDCAHPVGYLRVENVDIGFQYSITDQASIVLQDTKIETNVPNVYIIEALHLASSCVLSETVVIPIDTMAPMLSIIEMDSIVCEHRQINLGSVVDDTVLYQWSTANGHLVGPSTNGVVSLDKPGLYQLEVRSLTNSCIASADFLVEERMSNLSGLHITGIAANCDGEDDGIIVIDSLNGGTGPFAFSLNDEYYTSETVFRFLSPDEYQVFVQDVNGCFYDTLITLPRVPTFGVDLGDKEIVVNLGDTFDLAFNTDLAADQISEIYWYLPDSLSCQDCFDQKVNPLQNTRYIVRVKSASGCEIADTILVRVADPGGLFVPNAFTPNGDGVNDFLEVFVGNNIRRITGYEIFDRWGNNVFSVFDYPPGDTNARWDGTYKGQMLNPGVYLYMVQALDIRGAVKTMAGDITLLR